jgi:DNA-binding transcriptional LysR family regulator
MEKKKFNFSIFEAQLFCTLYDLGNTTATAKELGITPSLVSVTVSRLEKKLKSEGFFKKEPITSKYIPTQDAKDIVQSMRYIIQFAEDIKNKSSRAQNSVSITSTHTILHYYLGPWINDFIEKNPHISMAFKQKNDMEIKDQALNEITITYLVDDQVNNHYFPYHSFKQKLWAAPDYIDKHGNPSTIEELKKHRLLMRKDFHDPRILFGSNQVRSQLTGEDLNVYNIHSISLIDLLCEKGCGIMAMAEESVKLSNLNVENVFPDFKGEAIDFYVCARKEFLETKTGKDMINWIFETRNQTFRKAGIHPDFPYTPIK